MKSSLVKEHGNTPLLRVIHHVDTFEVLFEVMSLVCVSEIDGILVLLCHGQVLVFFCKVMVMKHTPFTLQETTIGALGHIMYS